MSRLQASMGCWRGVSWCKHPAFEGEEQKPLLGAANTPGRQKAQRVLPWFPKHYRAETSAQEDASQVRTETLLVDTEQFHRRNLGLCWKSS